MKKFKSPAVAAVFKSYPPRLRERLQGLRQLIFDTAAQTAGVGELEETLKWGEPAYLTSVSKSGSTIRIHRKPDRDAYAIYFNCQTNLVDTFRTLFPDAFSYEGNRAIVFRVDEEIPVRELCICISAALTYHLGTKLKR